LDWQKNFNIPFFYMPEVVFQCQDKTKHVEKRFISCLNKYLDEYSTKDRIVLSDSCDFDVFCHFIDFLVSGCIPRDKNDQIGVINLLREWESNFIIYECFRSRSFCQEKDGIIVYNGDKYEVNIGCLLFHSEVFREFYKNSCGMVFNISLSYSKNSEKSKESFEVFLDLIHNRIIYPSVEKAGDVYDICNCLRCDSLCQLLNDDSSERVLSLLIQNQDQDQNDSNIDFSKYERSITQKIDTYLKNPSFCLVSLPSLCRIFADSNQTFSLYSLEPFLIGCMKHHGTGAKTLLNNIKYQKPSDLSELNRFLQIMSIEDTNDIYDNTKHVLSSFQREFSSLREENKRITENYQLSVIYMNSKLKDLDKVIQELKSEIISAKATIGEQNNRIQEKDSKLADNIKLLQAKDAIISEQINQIKELKDEYPFKSDLFSGIFDGLSKKLGRNLADSSDVEVTASGIYNNNPGSYGPKNVLKNDASIWHSTNLPNSWIQFDFKERMVSITSYSLNDNCKVNSWKVEGSKDGSTFEIIHNKVDSKDTIDFQNSNRSFNHPSAQKNFPVDYNHKYFRYIRITSTGKRFDNHDYYHLFRVEFFGFVLSV